MPPIDMAGYLLESASSAQGTYGKPVDLLARMVSVLLAA